MVDGLDVDARSRVNDVDALFVGFLDGLGDTILTIWA
jgi:hypothetical protein